MWDGFKRIDPQIRQIGQIWKQSSRKGAKERKSFFLTFFAALASFA
jgi:hypothetical protein